VWTVFFNPNDGKQPKTFGFDLLILQFLTLAFLNFVVPFSPTLKEKNA